MHQFLSPLSNQRLDEYGGCLETGCACLLRVFREIRAALPRGFPLGVRISATDWVEGGWDLEQSTVFAARLKELGCDYIHVSSGGLSPMQKIKRDLAIRCPLRRISSAKQASPPSRWA